jgi:hypothetical protein
VPKPSLSRPTGSDDCMERSLAGVVELAFRLPTGDRSTRRFNVSDPVSHIFRCVQIRSTPFTIP